MPPPHQGLDSLANLRHSLPNGNLALKEEKDLMNNFKAAALSITTLYRSGLQSSKQAYTAGYEACLQDVLNYVQAGVSDGMIMQGTGGLDGQAMSVGRVMDWVEARLEDIKNDNGDEADSPEDDLSRKVSTSTHQPPCPPKDTTKPPTTKSLSPTASHLILRSSSPSPSPAPVPRLAVTSNTKHARKDKESAEPFHFVFDPPEHVAPNPIIGTKRRHSTMMYDHSLPVTSFTSISENSSPSRSNGIGPTGRRRGRPHRHTHVSGLALSGNGNMANGAGSPFSQPDEPMQVEFEEGRERKRVARR